MKDIENDFGDLFYHNGDASLILDAVRDMAEHLGHSLENPISLSLVCLNLAIPAKIADDISVEIFREFNKQNEQIDYDTMKKIIIRFLPEAKKFSEISIKAFLKGVAKSKYPDIEPFI
ncbi:MAG: hypothetical protein FWG67_04525 [Defluviitaleaceae bacterium]|nr:hypothetical protein [Defluviitaleaceae bacterium]